MSGRITELIAEVRSDLSKYDAAGLIDEISITRDIIKGLKKFGNAITFLQDTVVEVIDGYAELPDNFYALDLAYLCEPKGYTKKVQADGLMSSHFYRERTINTTKWNECDTCCEDKSESVIRENLYFEGSHVEFHYKNPVLLSLGKNTKFGPYHANCRNKYVKDCPQSIVINEQTLQANFSEGYIYIVYYGFEMDEDGLVDIPQTKSENLETYLEYHAKRRLAERLIGNNDAVGLASMYQVYAGLEQSHLKTASNEIKMMFLTPKAMNRIHLRNKLEGLQYEINF